jgi:hypothetical protein
MAITSIVSDSAGLHRNSLSLSHHGSRKAESKMSPRQSLSQSAVMCTINETKLSSFERLMAFDQE